MKSPTEIKDYLDNKHEIFSKIVDAIDKAHKKGAPRIYIKKLRIMDENLDVIANREDWPTCLDKALALFEQVEDYEACQFCKTLQVKITTPIKKTKRNAK
jgi:hypothetical protein